MWNRPTPPGFQGLREDLPLQVYTRHLPHWRQVGATYFVTFRLADSIPQSKLRELRGLRSELSRHPPRSRDAEQFAREIMLRVETWLDQGMGSCLLAANGIGTAAGDAMRHFDDRRYELGCYVVMPNHVHVIVRPFEGTTPERILQSWKRFTSRQIQRSRTDFKSVLPRGALWQDESFDRIIRDEEHLYRAIQYVGSNPARAHLALERCPRWIRPSWVEAGWGFES
jgi:REP element-mobilizing transposase RayT